jgi:hypothetical protein
VFPHASIRRSLFIAKLRGFPHCNNNLLDLFRDRLRCFSLLFQYSIA